MIPPDAAVGTLYGGLLTVTGRANIDGTLRLDRYLGYYHEIPLPSRPSVFRSCTPTAAYPGERRSGTSPGLFITGDLRYLEKDVYFDAESMPRRRRWPSHRAGDALTLHSAAIPTRRWST
ncbi:MAG: hypothetical protein U1F23_13085 [Lysobacterales bacterium]